MLLNPENFSTTSHPVIAAVFPFEFRALEDLMQEAEAVRPSSGWRKLGRSVERTKGYFAGRCAIKKILGFLRLDAKVRSNEEYGYLELTDALDKPLNGIYCNLSHTTGISVAAIAPAPIGIDIEDFSRSAERVLPRVATENELHSENFKNTPDTFSANPGILLWSSKEAVAKAFGVGMKFGLSAFEMNFQKNLPFPAKVNLKTPLKVENPGVWPLLYQNHVVSICTEEKFLKSEPLLIRY